MTDPGAEIQGFRSQPISFSSFRQADAVQRKRPLRRLVMGPTEDSACAIERPAISISLQP